VESWLHDHGIRQFDYSPARNWVTVSLPVSVVEFLLDTKYYIFCHEEDEEVIIRTLEWSIPLRLHGHVDAIQPTNSFLRPKAQDRYGGLPPPAWDVEGRIPTHEELTEEDILDRGHLDVPDIKDLPSNPTVSEACNRLAITPLCLRTLYGSLNYIPQVPGKNKVALVNFGGNVNNRSDISLFLERYRQDAAAANAAYTFETQIVADGDDQQTPDTPEQLKQWKGFEGALDAQTMLGFSYPTPMIAYNVGGKPPFKASDFTPNNSNEPYLEWLQYLLAQSNLPQVISISYADEEQAVPYSYAKRVCEGFAQLGARGVSVLVSSGDDGVGRAGHCISNDGHKKPQWLPMFPASCPFVTAVGATRLLEPEIVAFDARGNFVTGGGFSNYFLRPPYQDQVVDTYIRGLGDSFVGEGLYNKNGRAIPDVAAQGYHYAIFFNGIAHLRDGTSASTPTVASIISLVNDALIADGRPPLGFLNPWIYSKGFEAFKDVTIGSASGCNTTGFPAVEGWDAATGFGTPVSTQYILGKK
jgi:tripeptidyl-peptidase I